jgi:hypothetical protein
MCATFELLRVRKLTGKPAFLTIADCESEARRIQNNGDAHELPLRAAESNAFRTHSDLLSENLTIAALISRYSSGESRACIRMPRNLAFATFGLPIFLLIKYFVYDENNR